MKNIFVISLLMLMAIRPNLIYSQEKGVAPLTKQSQKQSQSKFNNVYALIVGVSKYRDPNIPKLNYADADAMLFQTYLQTYYEKDKEKLHIKVLLNEDATSAKVLTSLEWIKSAKEGDLVIIYFSGHGNIQQIGVQSLGFLICHDTDAAINQNSSIRMNDISSELAAFTAKKITAIFIADACHSGMANTETYRDFSLSDKQGAIKLLSSSGKQVSIEDPNLCNGHGYFTYYLIKALLGEADQDKDNKITIHELKQYLGGEMYNATNKKQSAQIISDDEEFVIGQKLSNTNEALSCLLGNDHQNANKIVYTKIADEYEDVRENLSFTQKRLYGHFVETLKDKNFTTPKNDNAIYWYELLSKETIPSNILSTIKTQWQTSFKEYADYLIYKYSANGKIPTYDEFEKGSEALKKYLLDSHSNSNLPNEYVAKQLFLEAYSFHRKETQNKLNKITENEKRENYKKYIVKLKQAIIIYPREAYLHCVLARLYKNIGDKKNAKEEYTKTQVLAPNWIFPKLNLIDLDANIEPKYAITEYKTILQQYPDYIDCYTRIADLYRNNKINLYDSSKVYLEKALVKANSIKEDSTIFANIYNELGNIHWNQKKYEEAETMYKTALRWSDGTYFWAANNLANMYKEMSPSKIDAAIDIELKSLGINPFSTLLCNTLGNLFWQKKDYQKALAYYEKGIEYDSLDADAYYYKGRYYLLIAKDKDYSLQLSYKAMLVETDSSYKGYYKVYYTYLLYNKKDYVQCISMLKEIFQDVKKLSPYLQQKAHTYFNERIIDNHYQLYYLMGLFYENGVLVTKNYKEAAQWYEWSLRSGVEQAAQKIENLYKQGVISLNTEGVNRLYKQHNVKLFSVPCIIDSSFLKKSIDIFTDDYPSDETQPMLDEVNRIRRISKASLPNDVLSSFEKLFVIAKKNSVSFGDLSVYALGEANKQKSKADSSKVNSDNINTLENESSEETLKKMERKISLELNLTDFSGTYKQLISIIKQAKTKEEAYENYYKIGYLYEKTPTTFQSNGKAIKWYSYSFQMGYKNAYHKLKMLYQYVSESKVNWLTKNDSKGCTSYLIPCKTQEGQPTKQAIYLMEFPTNPSNPLEKEQERLQDIYGVTISDDILRLFATKYKEAETKRESFQKNVQEYFNEEEKKREENSPETLFEKGRQLILNKEFEKSIPFFHQAIQIDNSKSKYHYLLGLCLWYISKREEGIISIKRAITLDPDQGVYYSMLGHLYIDLKEYPKAQEVYEKAYELGENKNSRLCYNLACLYSINKRVYSALRFLEEAIINGYNDFDHIAKDSDLDNIREDSRFKDLIVKYQKK